MKKYLREIQLAGIILLLIGVVLTFTIGMNYGVWPCAIGLLLWLTNVVYKAFHWQEYARENRQNVVIMLLTIFLLILQMIRAV